MATGRLLDSNRDKAGEFIGECTISHSCEPCMKSNESKTATIFCQDCDEYLCDTCKNAHNVYKPGRHDIVRIQDRTSGRVVVDMKAMEICRNPVDTSRISLSSHTRPLTLELIVSVDLSKTGDVEMEPRISGLDFMPNGRLVVVDNANKTCFILNERLQKLGSPHKFINKPMGVVCLSQNELAITCGKDVCFLSLSTDHIIRMRRTIHTSSKFSSICCESPFKMIVSTYDDPRPARMLSVEGVESDFDNVELPYETYKVGESACTYVQSKNTLVLTDMLAHVVYMFDTVKGTSKAITDEKIREPCGACVGPADTVLVISRAKNSLVHLTVEGDILCTYPVDIEMPWILCMNKGGTRLAVSNILIGIRKIQLYKISRAIS
ncbi:uncharacterized protein LOC127836639 [Dreissena polymorpha]|uniref:B box-type domain-containing protein n=1 Tax=Dreissena polymorpha TaxID=45954 RepID=A0A9D4G939_DREPO|nr:uncharacterized protein LOC127836639 [Dreissena polymorpha]KAH3812800.1 hypothetical protein DPMN_141239 [Dreissena polymorpha]